jgi:DNA modification methylase
MRWKVVTGDCCEVLSQVSDNKFDSIVCDPPYALSFMGHKWDSYAPAQYQMWCEEWAAECLRVLKPGGHLLAFGGTRTYHRVTCALENRDFEIRDSVIWLYGTGFPKSLDVSKAIDKAAGAERLVLSTGKPVKRMIPGADQNKTGSWIKSNGREFTPTETASATPDAERWEGWGTALKPSHEPIVVARKPLIGTVAQNVLEHGTGALNIDGCRIAGKKPDTTRGAGGQHGRFSELGAQGRIQDDGTGRWPANAVLDEDAAAELDAQTGGASRFFYCAKVSKKERTVSGHIDNKHPTVKPRELMRWLVRLVTPPNGVVLDPFTGSGSTGIACMMEGFRFVGIEKELENATTARERIELYERAVNNLRVRGRR